jgi:ferredoxin
MLKIKHRQRECIGCDSCIELAPDYFEMNQDGEATLLHKIGQNGPWIQGEGFVSDVEALDEAAAACPVQIIVIDR